MTNRGAERLHDLMIRKRWNQKQLAEWLGFDGALTSRLLRGMRGPSRKQAITLRELAKISFDEWDAPPTGKTRAA